MERRTVRNSHESGGLFELISPAARKRRGFHLRRESLTIRKGGEIFEPIVRGGEKGGVIFLNRRGRA